LPGPFSGFQEIIMHQTILFGEPSQTNSPLAATKPPTLRLEQVKIQWDAFQSLRRDLAATIDRLGDVMASANQIHNTFGITPTIVRRLAAKGTVRKTGRRRKRYHVRDVLLAVLHGGTGRIRRSRSVAGYGQLGTQAGAAVGGGTLPASSGRSGYPA
jgi:hypothetical protein